MSEYATRYESATNPLCYADQTLVERNDYVIRFRQNAEGRINGAHAARVWDTIYYEDGQAIGTVLVPPDTPKNAVPTLHGFEKNGQSYFTGNDTPDQNHTARLLYPLFRAGNYIKTWLPENGRVSMQLVRRRVPHPEPQQFTPFFFLREVLRRSRDNDAACLFALGVWQREKGNVQKAFTLFQRAAAHHHPEAWLELGLAYQHGGIFDADVEKAVMCFQNAAREGCPPAQYRLAMCHIFGKGVPHDDNEAVYLLNRAAEHDHPEACLELGKYYASGTFNGLRGKNHRHNHTAYHPHPEAAAAMFAKAALVRWPKAALAKFHLAECYRTGKGVRGDQDAALELYRQAVQEGDIEDEEIQAAAYHSRNVKVLGNAADNGHIYAAYLFGRMFWRGEPERDRVLGRRYLRQAAESGHECAEEAARLLQEKENQKP